MGRGLRAGMLGWVSLMGRSPGRADGDGVGKWKEPIGRRWGYQLVWGAGGIRANLITAEPRVCPGQPKPLPGQTHMLRLEVSKEQDGHQGPTYDKGAC